MIHIRRANLNDKPALARIRRDAILTLAVPTLSPEQAAQWASSAADDRIARAIREHEVWVAVADFAIGWIAVDRDRVAGLYVAPTYANQGVGSALLARAETAIHSGGYTTARLESSQNALAFYLRRSYQQCGSPDAEGAYPMRKDLTTVEPSEAATQLQYKEQS